LEWYGWHGFRRGIASNLYELGADEKVVQRVLRHAKSHVTKERYIKAFDPAVLAAMRTREFFGRHESECTKSAPSKLGQCGKLLKPNRGEVAEWLNAAVC
jgi:Phage integrase family